MIVWGYQPERFKASLYMLFYTLFASLPLLLGIRSLCEELGSGDLNTLGLVSFRLSSLMVIMLRAAFLVKFPIYLGHLWLPKAHVEAPVSGSMILAGVLLKLGGFGLYLVSPASSLGHSYIRGVIRLSLVGGGLVAVLILRTTDLKVSIAYSSVVHMRIVVVIFMGVGLVGYAGGILIMVAHGLTSSGMFSGVNIMYERSHRRRLILNKGLLAFAPFFTLM